MTDPVVLPSIWFTPHDIWGHQLVQARSREWWLISASCPRPPGWIPDPNYWWQGLTVWDVTPVPIVRYFWHTFANGHADEYGCTLMEAQRMALGWNEPNHGLTVRCTDQRDAELVMLAMAYNIDEYLEMVNAAELRRLDANIEWTIQLSHATNRQIIEELRTADATAAVL